MTIPLRMKNKKTIKIPIFFKVLILTVLLVSITGLGLGMKNASVFNRFITDREETGNLQTVNVVTLQSEILLESFIDKSRSLALEVLGNLENDGKLFEIKIKNDPDLISLRILNKEEDGKIKEINFFHSENEHLEKEKSKSLLKKVFSANDKSPEVFRVSKSLPFLYTGFPLLQDKEGNTTHYVQGIVDLQKLNHILSKETLKQIILLDKNGKLLFHPEEKVILSGELDWDLPIDVQNKMAGTGQKYISINQKNWLTAFKKNKYGILTLSLIEERSLLAPGKFVKKQTYYYLALALCFAFFMSFHLAFTMTNPIEKLFELTKQIALGNFDVNASEQIKSKDEMGSLAKAFDNMTNGLKEREKIKTMFNKFHGSSITEELMKSTLEIKGERKNVTVFFSDIRGFTAFSEGHTAEEVVEMVNEYFEAMVACILRNGGVVDKFIGDAIMAVWGAPEPGPDDACKAVKACLEMRVELEKFNQRRIERGLEPIKVGMGLNSGEAISGTIGSTERMEYTVIGDTVNTASRIEASTKAFGTDLLISQSTMDLVKEKYIISIAGDVGAKGKSDTFRLYKVEGIWRADNVPEIIQTPYSSYEAEKADKIKVA